MDLHRRAELRSIALHAVVAERLRADPKIVARARQRIERSDVHPTYRAQWVALLDGPLDELTAALVRDDEAMRALRQTTPFTFVVGPRERWRIWREVA